MAAKKDDVTKENEESEAEIDYECENTAEEDLLAFMRANKPIIYISTFEEQRVLKRIVSLCSKFKNPKQVQVWDAHRGLVQYTNESMIKQLKTQKAVADSTTIEQALLRIIDNITAVKDNQPDNKVYVLCDVHKFMNRSETGSGLERMLKNLSFMLGNVKSNIILLSPEASIPFTLEKTIPIIDYPLPSGEIIKTQAIDDVIAQVTSSPKNKAKVQGALDGMSSQDWEEAINSCKGLTVDEARAAVAKSFVKYRKICTNSIFEEKAQIVRKNGLLEFIDTSEVSIQDMGGMDQLKDWLSIRKGAFSQEAIKYGLRSPKGVVLLGIQGCGKSYMAKSTAKLFDMPCLRMDFGKLFGGIVGESESNIRAALRIAESISPSVLWIDEIEKGMSGTRSSGITDGGTTARVLATFLTWMQEKKHPVFVVATANDLSQLPPEIVRKGRFDEIFFIDLPSKEERADIFKIHIAKNKRNPANFDLEKLADISNGFSGAEIEESVMSAMYQAYSENMRDFATEDIKVALESTSPLSKAYSKELESIRESWVEEGRARLASKFKIYDNKGKKKSILKDKIKSESVEISEDMDNNIDLS